MLVSPLPEKTRSFPEAVVLGQLFCYQQTLFYLFGALNQHQTPFDRKDILLVGYTDSLTHRIGICIYLDRHQ
jgi:hypothetical protein